eukprot:514642-Pyramimonas_sp.AAC.1
MRSHATASRVVHNDESIVAGKRNMFALLQQHLKHGLRTLSHRVNPRAVIISRRSARYFASAPTHPQARGSPLIANLSSSVKALPR